MKILAKHIKLYLLMAAELLMLILMVLSSIGEASVLGFKPSDFYDNIQGRDYIQIDDSKINISYDPQAAVYDDEGRVIGDDLMTWKFSISSGAYDFIVDYEAEAENAYVELYSDSWITEPVSDKISLAPGAEKAEAKLYIPFGRAMHDVQINIHYTGPGFLNVYGIRLTEDTGLIELTESGTSFRGVQKISRSVIIQGISGGFFLECFPVLLRCFHDVIRLNHFGFHSFCVLSRCFLFDLSTAHYVR